jgi:hypothetical protein
MLDAAQEGASDVELRCLIGVASTAWYTLVDDDIDFCKTVKECKELCAAWWERRGREMAIGADGNATVWIFNMKNRFGWRDKQEIEQTVTGNHTHTVNVNPVDKFADILKDYDQSAE